MPFKITADQFEAMQAAVRPAEILRLPAASYALARARWRNIGAAPAPNGSWFLLEPLSAIWPVTHPGSLKVLSVGPRTEAELFHLMGMGFQPENISAIDLVATPPMIQAGDMHAIPFEAESFDVVACAGVLGFSEDPGLAVREMVRVTKSGGLLALAWPHLHDHAGNWPMLKADDLKALMGPALEYTHFQQDAAPSGAFVAMLIGRIRH